MVARVVVVVTQECVLCVEFPLPPDATRSKLVVDLLKAFVSEGELHSDQKCDCVSG